MQSFFEKDNSQVKNQHHQDGWSLASTVSIESSEFHFMDSKLITDKIDNFDTIVLCLQQVCAAHKFTTIYIDLLSCSFIQSQPPETKCRQFNGPHYISERQIKYNIQREQRVQVERERRAIITKDEGNRFIFNEKVKLLREIGPPWTWLHDFSEQDCRPGCGSFNFIEEESINSDATTSIVSGDESFDFVTEKPVKIQGLLSESPETITSDTASLVAKDSSCLFSVKLTNLKEKLEKETSVGELDISCTDSVISCLEREEFGVLKGAGEENVETVDIKDVIEILEVSKTARIKFKNLAEMLNYVSLQIPG